MKQGGVVSNPHLQIIGVILEVVILPDLHDAWVTRSEAQSVSVLIVTSVNFFIGENRNIAFVLFSVGSYLTGDKNILF